MLFVALRRRNLGIKFLEGLCSYFSFYWKLCVLVTSVKIHFYGTAPVWAALKKKIGQQRISGFELCNMNTLWCWIMWWACSLCLGYLRWDGAESNWGPLPFYMGMDKLLKIVAWKRWERNPMFKKKGKWKWLLKCLKKPNQPTRPTPLSHNPKTKTRAK